MSQENKQQSIQGQERLSSHPGGGQRLLFVEKTSALRLCV
jgi:hypothetical protein